MRGFWLKFIYVVVYLILKITLCYSNNINSNLNISNGFGDDYDWHSLKEGFTLARAEDKPLMVIIHKSGCPACTALKSHFSISEKTKKLSKFFIMVNVPSEEKLDDQFHLDGSYVPRIFFLDPGGEVHPEIFNGRGNPDYKYFYYDIEDVSASMKKAVSLFYSTDTKEL